MYGRHLLAAVPLPASAESPGSPGLSRAAAFAQRRLPRLPPNSRHATTMAMPIAIREIVSAAMSMRRALPALDVSNPDGPHTRPGSISSPRRPNPIPALALVRASRTSRRPRLAEGRLGRRLRRAESPSRPPGTTRSPCGRRPWHDRRLVTRADDHVLRVRRAVEEVPPRNGRSSPSTMRRHSPRSRESPPVPGSSCTSPSLSRRQDVEVDTEVVERRVVSSFEPK